jgi:hypothetical protein
MGAASVKIIGGASRVRAASIAILTVRRGTSTMGRQAIIIIIGRITQFDAQVPRSS